MREYAEKGARLGWLIDTEERKFHVNGPGETVEVADKPERISGDPMLPGFVLELESIREPGF